MLTTEPTGAVLGATARGIDLARPLSAAPKVVAGIGLLLAIAGAVASPDRGPWDEAARRIWVPLPDWLVVTAVAALSIAILVFLVMARPWRRMRKEYDQDTFYDEPQPIPRWLSVLLLLVSLTQCAVIAGGILWLAQSYSMLVPDLGRLMIGNVMAPTEAEVPAVPASSVTTGLVGTLLLLIGFGSLGVVLWVFFADRLRPKPLAFISRAAPLTAAVEESLDDLRKEPDARTAILRIYGNFERALAAVSLPRRPWQTPIEFMRTALAKLALPAKAVARLTALFELARFSAHAITSAQRDIALQSLIEIRETLDRGKEAER
jgi:hypothetical protein